MQQAPPDITRTRSLITDYDVYLFRQGSHSRLYDRLGSHPAVADGRRGTFFAVWAPNAAEVSVIGDFNGWEAGRNPLSARSDDSGIWEGFLPDIGQGALYKYHIRSRYNDYSVEKGDPFARFWEIPPKTASIVWDLAYTWRDRAWMRGREEENSPDAPISVYEMHAGSWRKVPEEGNRSLSYREAADELAEYLVDAGFTHVEFLPIMEHPFYASWGYQTLGYFAPTSRYGTPQDFMHLIDCLHQRGVGVILDWVPSHFPADGYGLSYFDGTYLYEHALPGQRYHPEWKSYVFNLARNEVRSFLLSSAIFWLERYHADGLRVDAVSSMLYLDYARSAGEWTPNVYGGRENLEAIGFLRKVNETVHANFPDVLVIAEEATSWPGVTAPTATGGLGFDLKWNMGWMHDTLDYFVLDPVFRKYRPDLFTFSIWYAFNERYVLPLSHDEVVHEKSSLIGKMPGDEWRKRANLRLLYGYMFTHPGKKLLFMGGEFGQWSEWSHDAGLEWHLLQYPSHQGILRWTGDLNRLYRRAPALHERDADPEGFEWVDFSDVEKSIVSYLRRGRSADDVVLVVCNCTPVPRYNYRVGVPFGGFWEEVLNSDAVDYGGSGVGNLGGVEAEQVPVHGRPWSLPLTLPPLGVVIFAPEGA
ncbi:1,4-alpha-glucan branching protein GlgB [Methanoculleus sp. 10]|jgi:1,4-alpha-glucan branching enzyme|uniref:1,4-alpha-glucan branching protein GlgB n=1 Tax=Methanoculleus sp. 10 TaxID=430615 RepID=UPI001B5E22F0|nr:1,4-alpha-glucan branching protein GlgB [Methanoculleus sp. 10]MBP7410377.1 1,4-alpha-glucan branching protein GlgB [Methanoculleus sp.]